MGKKLKRDDVVVVAFEMKHAELVQQGTSHYILKLTGTAAQIKEAQQRLQLLTDPPEES